MKDTIVHTSAGGARNDLQPPKRGWENPVLVSVGRLGDIMQGSTNTLLPDTGQKAGGKA